MSIAASLAPPCFTPSRDKYCTQAEDCHDQLVFTDSASILRAYRLFFIELRPVLFQSVRLSFPAFFIWDTFLHDLTDHQKFVYGSFESLRSVQLHFQDIQWQYNTTYKDPRLLRLITSHKVLAERALCLQELCLQELYLLPTSLQLPAQRFPY